MPSDAIVIAGTIQPGAILPLEIVIAWLDIPAVLQAFQGRIVLFLIIRAVEETEECATMAYC